jgi:CheY-like chemotaxis protein
MSAQVLVVDDDADMRLAIREVLLEQGLSVVVAADGQEALECADRARPALVILDITLPILDGYAVAEGLHERFGPLPILAVTADGGAPQKARRVGAFAFLRKPFELDDLVRSVERGLAFGDGQH